MNDKSTEDFLVITEAQNYQTSTGFSAFILWFSYIVKVFSKITKTVLQNINILGQITDELTQSPCYTYIIPLFTHHVC